ncbi:MAG: DUF262 domain-containing protein [Oscillatoria sp. SIO1A7]|nr:DUF262 domain-containing protein [Oscillatoria sp. SIO1A7]
MLDNTAIAPNEHIQELPIQEFDAEDEEEMPEIEIPVQGRKLVTQPYDFIIRSLKDQVDEGSLILADNFQRRQVWDFAKSSRLIESLLLNVPIPVCYFAELDSNAYSVIDGQQRLTAIYRFLNNEYGLRRLKVLPELNRKKFQDLAPIEQRALQSRTIRCIVILKESHPHIKYDVFERLNSGFVPLNAQELRNSVYRGNLNNLIQELCEDEIFQKIRNVSTIDKRMQDCELILRFFAFHFSGREYKGNLARFLDNYLEKGMEMPPENLEHHRQIFRKVVDDVDYVFEKQAFRRYNLDQGWERSINRAIYDAIMQYFALLDSEVIRGKKEEIIKSLKQVCQDPEFNEAISSSTKNKDRIQTRLDKWKDALVEVGLDVPCLKIGQ